ncbi:hypothetical protein EXS65_01435 [Candidatus Peribacteria bacterium]|nr:hypothetical protein [Candidatus Peribacteria bacterium]
MTALPDYVRLEQQPIAYVRFMDEIRPQPAMRFIRTVEELVQNGAKELHLAIKSPGGSHFLSMAMYQALRKLGIPITTYARNFVESAALIPFLAGDHRFAEPDSKFLIHPPTISHASEEQICLISEGCERDVVEKLLAHTSITRDKALELLSQQSFLSADQAKEFNIVHEVAPIVWPHDANVVNLFQEAV